MGDLPAETQGQMAEVCSKDKQTELVERVAAIHVAVGPDTANENGHEAVEGDDIVLTIHPANNQRNSITVDSVTCDKLDGSQELDRPKRIPARPALCGRKYSLQEKPSGNFLASTDSPAFGPYSTGPSTHISPRIVRRPTIESHRVSISDAADCVQLNQYQLKSEIGKGSYGVVKLAFSNLEGAAAAAGTVSIPSARDLHAATTRTTETAKR